MPETYFSKFNKIDYNDKNNVVDITERIVVTQNSLRNPYVFYPFDITDGSREDMIAYDKYNDSYLSWIVYLSNEIQDTYYDWYLTEEQFDDFLVIKYGSIQSSVDKVKYYQSDPTTSDAISVSAYGVLSANQQQYYTANYNGGSFIINYIRKPDILTSNTNKILNLSITGNSFYTNNEIVDIKYQSTSNGSGQVLYSNGTNLIIQHVFNDSFPHDSIVIDANSYVVGRESSCNTHITACSFVANNIPDEEFVFWKPVYYYDYEREKNEGNRTIRVIKSDFIPKIISDTKSLLKTVVS